MLITSPRHHSIRALKHDRVRAIFLAGSIENGTAEPWQEALYNSATKLAHEFGNESFENDFVFINPRRKDWDSNADSDVLREQIEWELDGLENSDCIVFYFAPGTISPISLLELGLYLKSDKHIVLVVNEDYFRYTNVVQTAEKFGKSVEVLSNLEEAAIYIARFERGYYLGCNS